MTTTENLKLRKPAGADKVLVGDLNYNADIIDAAVKALRTDAETAAQTRRQLVEDVAALQDKKMDTPEQDGEAGQALCTDGKGGVYWTTIESATGTGLSPEAAQLLIDILKAALYNANISSSVAQLAGMLGAVVGQLDAPTISIDYAGAVLGQAILGKMVLGTGGGGGMTQLATPVITLVADVLSLATPVITITEV